MPGNPRKWSPWKWERKTRETCMKLKRLCMNCRWVPSPQSNKTISGPRFTAIALTFRFGVGQDPDVPRKTICMDPLPNTRRRLTPLDRAHVALRPGAFETTEPESGEELGRPSEGEPRDERETKFQGRVLPETEVDLSPSQISLEGSGVGGLRKVCEDGGKPRGAFIRFEAKTGKTPEQSLFRRHRAMADEAFHSDLTAGGRPAATGTCCRSHPFCDLGRSVAPRRFRNAPHGTFTRHSRRFPARRDL